MNLAELLAARENQVEEEAWEHAFDEMAWARPQNSIQEINAAGKLLARGLSEDYREVPDEEFNLPGGRENGSRQPRNRRSPSFC